MTTADTTALTFSGPDPAGQTPATTTPTAAAGTVYSNQEWEHAAAAVREADAAVLAAREAKRRVDIAYGEALAAQTEAQKRRDQMIVTDPRTSAEVSRHAGITRVRCSQIRSAHGISRERPMTDESRRLVALVTKSGTAA